MDAAAWIGPLAGVLSTASFVPQPSIAGAGPTMSWGPTCC
jgi:hypothetical protein